MSETVKKPSSRVGLRDVVWCLVTADTQEAYETDTVRPLAGAINADFTNNNSEADIQHFDDEEGDVLYPDPEVEFSLELADLPPDEAAAMVGATVDGNGVTIDRAGDKPPYIAIGFKSKKSNGVDRYIWLYKARCFIPSESYRTKEGETLTRQTEKLTITAIKRNKDGAWRAKVDTDNPLFASAQATFFSKPYEPNILEN